MLEVALGVVVGGVVRLSSHGKSPMCIIAVLRVSSNNKLMIFVNPILCLSSIFPTQIRHCATLRRSSTE